jgi:hypothetical protein
MTSASYQGRNTRERPEPEPMSEIRPIRLVVHCLIERVGDQWQAFSLELGLAVQGDSCVDVRRKLASMIEFYVRDALCGEDREHAYELLVHRKATWRVYLRYYRVWLALHVATFMTASTDAMIYREPLPLEPKHCAA